METRKKENYLSLGFASRDYKIPINELRDAVKRGKLHMVNGQIRTSELDKYKLDWIKAKTNEGRCAVDGRCIEIR